MGTEGAGREGRERVLQCACSKRVKEQQMHRIPTFCQEYHEPSAFGRLVLAVSALRAGTTTYHGRFIYMYTRRPRMLLETRFRERSDSKRTLSLRSNIISCNTQQLTPPSCPPLTINQVFGGG